MGTGSSTCSHSERLLAAAVQALVLPCLSRRARCGCQASASIPHVRKVLDAVICRLDTRRDFRPIGSEHPGGRTREDGRGDRKQQGERVWAEGRC